MKLKKLKKKLKLKKYKFLGITGPLNVIRFNYKFNFKYFKIQNYCQLKTERKTPFFFFENINLNLIKNSLHTLRLNNLEVLLVSD